MNTITRGFSVVLTTILATGCGGGGGGTSPTAPRVLSVGGAYAVAVDLVSNTCGPVTVLTQPTSVVHSAGASRFTLTHGGTSYAGSVAMDGAFTTDTLALADSDGQPLSVRIDGRFTATGLDATVGVDVAAAGGSCRYVVHWAGTKQGSPNVLP